LLKIYPPLLLAANAAFMFAGSFDGLEQGTKWWFCKYFQQNVKNLRENFFASKAPMSNQVVLHPLIEWIYN